MDHQPSDPQIPAETYHRSLLAGSGGTDIDLKIDGDQRVEILIQSRWMGSGKHSYRLIGRRYAISASHGWLLVEHARHQNSDSGAEEEADLEILGVGILYEYFRIERSAHYEPPADLALMQPLSYANWNETSDLVLMLHPFIQAHLIEIQASGYRYSQWNEALDDPEEITVPAWMVHALLILEKTKYARVGA